MRINDQPLTFVPWRRLDPQLRAELHQVLCGKQAILDRPVLDVARDLCARGAALLAWHPYQGLDGQTFTPYEGCRLGLTMDLRRFMGEDGEPCAYGSEEAPLLLPRERRRARGGQNPTTVGVFTPPGAPTRAWRRPCYDYPENSDRRADMTGAHAKGHEDDTVLHFSGTG